MRFRKGTYTAVAVCGALEDRRRAIDRALIADPSIQVIAEAVTVAEAVALTRNHKLDALIYDLDEAVTMAALCSSREFVEIAASTPVVLVGAGVAGTDAVEPVPTLRLTRDTSGVLDAVHLATSAAA
jgi:DNA-binding NarL/FixJ family response regulator